MNATLNIRTIVAAASALALMSFSDGKTRGPGKYPGNPAEDYAPSLVPAGNDYRNVALNRMVRTSSQHDFNLTPQLLTDGIVTTANPPHLVATTNSGTLSSRKRECAIDGNEYTNVNVMGNKAWLDFKWHNMSVKASRVKIFCTVAYHPDQAKGGYAVTIASQQRTLAQQKSDALPGKESKQLVSSDPNKQTGSGDLPLRIVELDMPLGNGGATELSHLRFNFDMAGAAYWTITEIKFFNGNDAVTDLQPARDFGSAWMSDNGGQQWAYVDLGSTADIDNVKLCWIEKAVKGRVDVATEMGAWHTVAQLPGGKALTDNIKFKTTKARYVRVLMTQPTASGRYVMSEMEVMGRGGLVAKSHAIGGTDSRGRYLLDGGNWQLARASQVSASGEQIASPGFKTDGWIAATVPGTVLTSYVNVGALPDPAFSDNWYNASESFFNSNFWYRTTFRVPQDMKGRHIFLNFDGINWKADVYLNGKKIDRIEGAFTRSKCDVTSLLNLNGDNTLAVEIVKNAHPGSVKEKNRQNTDFNGGILGYDNPTFHATIGWDWITTVRGRDIGIWNDVALTAAGSVSLSDPLVSSELELPDTTATMTASVVVRNNEQESVTGTLRGWIGDIKFERKVTLAPGLERQFTFSPDEFAQLKNRNMRLWWPNGYGEPYLYDAGFEFVADATAAPQGTAAQAAATPSDRIDYKAGIRQMTYRDMDTRLAIYVNGRRLIPLGGNWGFSEQNLLYRAREYDIAVRYHRDMNFNMIRNWVGMTGDEEFYDACDKYGIMVWQDFWLANPCDGPDPKDENMFLANARDYTLRMRQHPSIGIYCGRNEGYPPASIDKVLREYVSTLNPGLGYISSSADDGVSGHGPYWACTPKFYFEHQTGKLHSERGMPNMMTAEGLYRTLTERELWPQGDAWGAHDYCMEGAQRGATFNAIIDRAFGMPNDAAAFAALAQWENYDGYRAMYESGAKDRMGLLIWMSHSCWPSMTWCCYDYYFEPTAAFFGCKKACEPLHIQWNASTRNPEVVNLMAGERKLLTAKCQIMNAFGKVVKEATATVNSADDSTVEIPALHVDDNISGLAEPGDDRRYAGTVYFVRLTLTDAANNVLSENTYVDSNDKGNLKELRDVRTLGTNDLKVEVASSRVLTSRTLTITNTSDVPAMMLRLNLVDSKGEQILPVSYSDNYFHLMPGEARTVVVEWNDADCQAPGLPKLMLTGFNTVGRELGLGSAN